MNRDEMLAYLQGAARSGRIDGSVYQRVRDYVSDAASVRTCHMEDVDTEPGGYQGTGLCSECGELLIPSMRFCPHCGARVVIG